MKKPYRYTLVWGSEENWHVKKRWNTIFEEYWYYIYFKDKPFYQEPRFNEFAAIDQARKLKEAYGDKNPNN